MKASAVALVSCLGAVTVWGCSGSAPSGTGANTAAPAASTDPGRESAAAATASDRQRARAEADAALEARRLAALWGYYDVPVGQGHQRSAAIYSRDDVDTDGQGARRVRLVFRDHPSWGKSSYLVLETGDFNCYGGCTVAVTVDDAKPTRMAAHRPKTDEAIAMFINDARALWRMTRGAKLLAIDFPAKGVGTRTAVFEVAGLDRSRLPGWDPAP
jgi:hypothetical protein